MRSTKLPLWTRPLLGLTPVAVPPHVFSLEQERLRYARFHPGARSLELREHVAVDLEPGLFADGPLAGAPRDPERLAEAISALTEDAATTVREASLILPDEWLRVAFAEAADVPPRGAQRDAVIRFKLRRLVPFRVEDLRVAAAETVGLNDEDERRLMLGFASEGLVAELEEAFRKLGIRIGSVSNQSLSLLNALHADLAGAEAGIFIHAQADSYRLMVTRRGEPVLHRHKTLGDGRADDLDLVFRDLRLTGIFVANQMIARPGEVIFVGPASTESAWEAALEKAFETPVRCLVRDWGEVPGTVTGVPADEAAVLLGAASRRVS